MEMIKLKKAMNVFQFAYNENILWNHCEENSKINCLQLIKIETPFESKDIFNFEIMMDKRSKQKHFTTALKSSSLERKPLH